MEMPKSLQKQKTKVFVGIRGKKEMPRFHGHVAVCNYSLHLLSWRQISREKTLAHQAQFDQHAAISIYVKYAE